MRDITAPAAPGMITLDPGDDPETAWSRLRDLGRASGLAPLRAARLALAVTTVVGQRCGPTVVEIARVDDAQGAHVEATIDGGNATPSSAPPGLVDASRRHLSAARTVTWILPVNVTEDAATDDPAWAELNDAAARSPDTRRLLLALLAAVARHHADRTGGVDSEVLALRIELDESNQGLLALHAELSEQHDELEHARAAAEQATRDKADFLANMSHEIRSPMNAVVGFTSLLRATELTTEQVEYTEALEVAGGHLLGVIEGILDLSRIESGLLELEDIPFDLFACVEDAVDMLAASASEKNLALAALFVPNMPASIVGDSLRLRQILVNLLANAVKFTTRGHVLVEVTQEAAAGSSRKLAFHVRDTGSGIPAERVELLFAPYTQADASTARSHGGTGLGLAICRQLAERMGGNITADSTVGEGSTFTCTIRAQVAELTPASVDNDPVLSGLQVLVVNTQALHGEAIGRHLAVWGAELVTASSIDAAVSRSADWPRAALAIIDVNQPATLAADIARLTSASVNAELPVICVATMASRAALARAGELRPSVRIPVRRDHLRKAVLAALSKSSPPAPSARAAASATPKLLDSPGANDSPAALTIDIRPRKTDETPTPADPPQSRRVLFVDDNPLLTELVERIFAGDPGVTVQTAPDGRTALRLASQQQPDIVLLDLHLSDMSGEALLRQLNADTRTRWIPAVIVSGATTPAAIERLSDLGVVAYLTKPFTSSQLRKLVNAVGRPDREGTVPTP